MNSPTRSVMSAVAAAFEQPSARLKNLMFLGRGAWAREARDWPEVKKEKATAGAAEAIMRAKVKRLPVCEANGNVKRATCGGMLSLEPMVAGV